MNKDRENNYEGDSDDEEEDSTPIIWSNIIFLPFHPFFQFLVLVAVVLKTTCGPLQTVYPSMYCTNVMDKNIYLLSIKYGYYYCADTVYAIDTIFHILHKQVTEVALRRDHLPKSGILLLIDVVALIPLFRMLTPDTCEDPELWPHIAGFTEFFIIYRVIQYFCLMQTHSKFDLIFGSLLVNQIILHCITCLWLLLTNHGMCTQCDYKNETVIYDWRQFLIHKFNETERGYSEYVYSLVFVLTFMWHEMLDNTWPSTYTEFLIICFILIFGYVLTSFVLFPKVISECLLSMRRIIEFLLHTQRIVGETKSRNPSLTAHLELEKFYNLMWKKRRGIMTLPNIMTAQMPKYLRTDIKLNLMWPVFFHSPTFRRTSDAYKRWICHFVRSDYKLPGETFFAGLHSRTNLYYLKSGIIQIMSADDGVSPVLSVTAGTVFGDISFFLPPLKKKVKVRCLTYCEVFYLGRSAILKSLHVYPKDRCIIMQRARDRIKHARTLYTCKQHIKGLDRSEDEGVAWIKRRWWEISDYLSNWKTEITRKTDDSRSQQLGPLPPEEAIYHCSKFIGQLVLCTKEQLQRKSLFTHVKFPWLILKDSIFILVWNRIMVVTIFFVLILFPPNIVRYDQINWFRHFERAVLFIYCTDIFVSLHASIETSGNETLSFVDVLFTRFKSPSFLIDLLSCMPFEKMRIFYMQTQYYNLFLFNRVLRVYRLFSDEYIGNSIDIKSPLINTCYKVIMSLFSYVYIASYFKYTINRMFPLTFTATYFFGRELCLSNVTLNECILGEEKTFMAVFINYAFELIISDYLPLKLIDLYISVAFHAILITNEIVCRSNIIAAIFLNQKGKTDYQFFVSNIRKLYIHHKIHPDLLMMLNRYLTCHWKYYHGRDVIHPKVLKDEPYDIYWKVHGEMAVKVISESRAFQGADRALIRELAYNTKILVLPKNATIVLFGGNPQSVSWLLKGNVKCEYHDQYGELWTSYYQPGQMISDSSTFLGGASLRTQTCYTDCEIIYLKTNDLFNVLKRYPLEWSYFKSCMEEYSREYQKLFLNYLLKHRNYRNRLMSRVFHFHGSNASVNINIHTNEQAPPPSSHRAFLGWTYALEPESNFVKYWAVFRVLVVCVSITCASLQGGSGAAYRYPLVLIGTFCDTIAIMDIIIKLCTPFYDERGILISDIRKTCVHYLTRGFLLDIIGALPWCDMVKYVPTTTILESDVVLINTACKFAHIYLLTGFFNYLADGPAVKSVLIMIVKWKLFTCLMMLAASHYFISKCVDFTWEPTSLKLLHMARRNECWVPTYIWRAEVAHNFDESQLHLLFASSLNLGLLTCMGHNIGKFKINSEDYIFGFFILFLRAIVCYSASDYPKKLMGSCNPLETMKTRIQWLVTATWEHIVRYIWGNLVTIIVVHYRGYRLYKHEINKLTKFLKSERVDKTIINTACNHFRYYWLRTKGLNMQNLMSERIGGVFRQDLRYFFYKKTLKSLDTLLKGGETLERELAEVGTESYFLPGAFIMREMDLIPWVYVVHRGTVTVTKNDVIMAVLTKGAIFGELNRPNAVSVTVEANSHVDLLQIPSKLFYEILNDEVKENLKNNPESQDDFMSLKVPVPENPYNTIPFILRGRKTIQLPGMRQPTVAQSGTWYYRWLTLVWLIAPVISATLALLMPAMPSQTQRRVLYASLPMDFLHLAHVISEMYTMELTVHQGKLFNRRLGYRVFQYWGFYVDVITLVTPLYTLYDLSAWYLQLAKLFRLRLLYVHHYNFCRSLKPKSLWALMNAVIIFLIIHTLTCGWIIIACRNRGFETNVTEEIIHDHGINYNNEEWTVPEKRPRSGCARLSNRYRSHEKSWHVDFLVPTHWAGDYLLSLAHVLVTLTRTNLDVFVALTIPQLYYRTLEILVIQLFCIWITSLAIGFGYMRLREIYQYDYGVSSLEKYLCQEGLSPNIIRAVLKYTNQLWQRQKGNWLPELVNRSPLCLRSDLFSALYMHHLDATPIFRDLPPYFKRQLVTRLKRVVVFPDKFVVQEGDVLGCIYFIHEGEVMKLSTDPNSGEKTEIGVLGTNGFFGIIPGLFPDVPFMFSYYTKTVVDFASLKNRDWQDLLEGYPEIQAKLYEEAKHLRKDVAFMARINAIVH